MRVLGKQNEYKVRNVDLEIAPNKENYILCCLSQVIEVLPMSLDGIFFIFQEQ